MTISSVSEGADGESVLRVWGEIETPRGPRRIAITTGEQEGGEPTIAAIGFANADRDPARELIVILVWRQQHYDVNGMLYEVRVFDDWREGGNALRRLPKVERLFARHTCDCSWRDGRREHFRYATIDAIRRRLRAAGY